MFRKIKVFLVAAALGLTPMVASVATAPAAEAAYCGITWGSLPKTNLRMSSAPIFNVRAGRQTCYDRMVVDVRGRGEGYDVRYVSTLRADGSGQVVSLRGGAKLQVIVRAPAYNIYTGAPTYRPANRNELVNVSTFTTFRQIKFVGSFEGQTQFGLGVRARLPFRVFVLAGPGTGSRVVVDVAHRW